MRMPRPQGITLLSNDFNKETNTKEKESKLETIYNLVIKQYILGGYTIQGRTFTFGDLEKYLGLSKIALLKKVTNTVERICKLGDKDGMADFARGILSMGFETVMSVHHTAKAQVDLLTASQAGSYKPFISPTVNASITNLISSSKSFLEMYRAVSGPQNLTQILNQNMPNNRYLGTEEALILINKKTQNQLPEASQLALVHNIDAGPEIRANYQQGNERDMVTVFKTPTRSEAKAHTLKREKEEGLDENFTGSEQSA